jgi:hypothetical protein
VTYSQHYRMVVCQCKVNRPQDQIDEDFKSYYRSLQRLNDLSKKIADQDADEVLRIIANDIKAGRKCDCG